MKRIMKISSDIFQSLVTLVVLINSLAETFWTL